MILLPAIDLRGGECVRLVRGDFDTAERVADDAAETARHFLDCGAEELHVVDLDGALCGRPENIAVLREILRTGARVEFGGGVRTLSTVEQLLSLGVQRVILGSAALRDSRFVRETVRLYGNRIAVGIDARGGLCAADGWLTGSDTGYLTLAREMERCGIQNIIYTDIGRDGTLSGPNLEELRALSETVDCRITASGGVRSEEDVAALRDLGLHAAIAGRAVYCGALDLRRALALAKGD
ncbi:1-(5-phosphoribosyl)-5-[(5-phosphoribosylamino)methylideneamino]imidazole-4-carboxamide isomerase [Feifania hominis]|uniref:1-(5-phosphoribosyl)-5-[(5-phosphoribosylamino)methylideneamino] imidazole-4-carboxamide isomerase n=1 Tax=Feifania hominis TaxID=2763660 RepID=A0A926DDI5_9FIRM|nr:1-(5-phosphoribosyl)-5-[(5-phosphoribosylamino)methylideneamino]imidazole-4-carboxamide isomerase [Feifania hominis]MBC8536206.1 1-(5-phosphoribosyl)-5-[(5-phosphoribosylamino)methylideneamino]imidazole-4-carboxamide isomerase [Feifania hominis]